MRIIFAVLFPALLAACDVPEGTTSQKGVVSKVDGDTVIVSVAMGMTPLRLSGPTPQQTAEAQRVCDLKKKQANYVSYDTRTEAFGATVNVNYYDLIFVCT